MTILGKVFRFVKRSLDYNYILALSYLKTILYSSYIIPPKELEAKLFTRPNFDNKSDKANSVNRPKYNKSLSYEIRFWNRTKKPAI